MIRVERLLFCIFLGLRKLTALCLSLDISIQLLFFTQINNSKYNYVFRFTVIVSMEAPKQELYLLTKRDETEKYRFVLYLG